MPETCENSLGLVNNCVYYVRQTREIYQVLPYSMELPWVRQYLKNVVLFEILDL